MGTPSPTLRVGIAGFGSIGKTIAKKIDAGIPGLRVAALGVRDVQKARDAYTFKQAPVYTDIDHLSEHCDIVVECAPAALLPRIAEPVLKAGKKLLVLSSGALLLNQQLVDIAREHGGQIIVATGALIGLDAVTAAAEGTINEVRMVSRKPPLGFAGAPYVVQNNIDLDAIKEPTRIYSGTAREAATGFPANLNVAVSLSLAGVGPDRTILEIWADPTVSRNIHRIEVDSEDAKFSMEIQNVPSENPKTGRITALSAVAALRKLVAPLRIGT
ncbi:aspartate dehydrogenase [Bordetella sp. 15P40C-2]|uniref:aspartate dehydrogenase n=1 Tax=Bordetella sp. 15P40C-2 TaxID=2572246 RepID=UPI0013290905|nr:aspartate dehydrogenase [Bordetella sp. 15P40C-2]MVW71658.1 aspartate dehydrogenase [Bordetella sp. 15P40C-2]